MTTLEILAKARGLIATPEKWTQEAFGRSKTGRRFSMAMSVVNNPEVTCRCIGGAVFEAMGDGSNEKRAEEIAMAMDFDDLETMYNWNDRSHRTHAEVLARLDAAISKLKAVQP